MQQSQPATVFVACVFYDDVEFDIQNNEVKIKIATEALCTKLTPISKEVVRNFGPKMFKNLSHRHFIILLY